MPFAAVAFAASCTPDPIVEETILPYEGQAFPDRVEPIAYPTTPVGFVTDSLSDTVSVIDLTTGERIAARPVGRNPVDIDGPHHIAIPDDPTYAYVALSYPPTGGPSGHAIHGTSQQLGYIQKLRTSDFSVVAETRIDRNPGDIIVSPDGSRVVASHFDLLRAIQNPNNIETARATIAVVSGPALDGPTPPAAKLIKVCVAPHGLVMTSPPNSLLYVACYGEDRLAIVNLDDEAAPIERIDVGPNVTGFGSPKYGPYALTLSPDEQWLLVSSTVSKDIRFFNMATKAFDDSLTFTAFGAPYFPAFSADGSHLAIVTQQPDALQIIDLTGTDEPLIKIFDDDECDLPHVVTMQDTGYLVVCEGNKRVPGKVIHLDAGLQITWSREVGLFPDAIVVRDGSTLTSRAGQ